MAAFTDVSVIVNADDNDVCDLSYLMQIILSDVENTHFTCLCIKYTSTLNTSFIDAEEAVIVLDQSLVPHILLTYSMCYRVQLRLNKVAFTSKLWSI